MLSRGRLQSLQRLMQRLEAEAETSVMHRDESLRFQFNERFDRFFRIHVNFAAANRLVSADGQKRDVDLVMFADFPEAGEESTVAAMKNRSAIHGDGKPAKTAMQIGQETRAPMITGRQRNFDRAEFDRLPVIELVHNLKPEIVHEISHADGDDDRLIGRDFAQGAPVEMIEVRMCDENEIDLGQVMNFKSGLLQTFDHAKPLRPIGIDENVDLRGLEQERRVPNPGDADLALANFWEYRRRIIAGALDEKGRDQHFGEEAASRPIDPWSQLRAR